MSEEYRYLLHILESFINKKAPKLNSGVDWDTLLYIAHIHSVDGILAYMVKQYGICDCEEINAYMRDICLKNIALYNKRAALMELLIEKMQAAQIEHILFKGYILKDYYPVPELRSFGDIDFIIHEYNREKMNRLMLEDGYALKTNWEPAYSYLKGIEYYEIHTDIMEVNVSDRADYMGYFKDMWRYVEHINDYSNRFTHEYHFIYLLTHIAKHAYGSGAGIRMYMDIALFVEKHREDIDWGFIREELIKLELYDFSCVVFAVVEKWFKVRPPFSDVDIKEKLLTEFELFTVKGGTYGQINRDNGINELRKNSENEKKISKAGVVLKRLFPPASDIESRYTYLKGKHWLLPAAWVHRLFITRGKWQDNVQEAQSILAANSREVAELKRFYKEIGL